MSMKKNKSNNEVTREERFRKATRSIGAVPYRLGILMPRACGPKPKSIMMKNDFVANPRVPNSFREFMISFLLQLQNFKSDEETFSGVRIDKSTLDTSIENEIRFVLQAGRYGIETELYNVDNPSKVKTREVVDCEVLPFCCRMYFDERYGGAIVIFEKFGVNSAVTIFRDELNRYVKKCFADEGYGVDLLAIGNREYVERQFKNAVKAVHFVKYVNPTDEADVLKGDSAKEVDQQIKMELSYYAPTRGFLHVLDKIVDAVKTHNMMGIRIGNQKYSKVGIELKSGKRTQTVFSTDDMFTVAFDLTEKVDIAVSGHPSPDSFYAHTAECLDMSKKTIKWE